MATTKDEIFSAHKAMADVLDAKFKDVPEWAAFRHIDRALLALIEAAPTPAPRNSIPRYRPKAHTTDESDQPKTYIELSLQALDKFQQPLPTPKIIDYIGKHRELPADADKVRANVVSALSHNDGVRSIAWQGGRAWWYAEKPIPKPDSAA